MASEYKMDFSRHERQAAEDFQRHQADLENAAGQDEVAVVRRAIRQTLTAMQALGTGFNQEIDALSCRSTNFSREKAVVPF